jgi:hypothetical protein
MKPQIILILILLTLASTVEAGGQASQIYPPLKSNVINLGQGCRIRIDLPKGIDYGVRYETPIEKRETSGGSFWFSLMNPPPNSENWSFGFICHHIVNYNARGHHMEVWDDKAKRWVLNPVWENDPYLLSETHFRIFQIKTHTAQGWITIYDDFNGEEKIRKRNLQFCVFRNERAICSGEIEAGNLEDIRRQPHVDHRVPYILKIVNSIEFLEDAPPPPSSNMGPHSVSDQQ